jgi:hypothetical protein
MSECGIRKIPMPPVGIVQVRCDGWLLPDGADDDDAFTPPPDVGALIKRNAETLRDDDQTTPIVAISEKIKKARKTRDQDADDNDDLDPEDEDKDDEVREEVRWRMRIRMIRAGIDLDD